jgi:hypothetical protein
MTERYAISGAASCRPSLRLDFIITAPEMSSHLLRERQRSRLVARGVINSIRRIGARRQQLRPSNGRDAAARRDITELPIEPAPTRTPTSAADCDGRIACLGRMLAEAAMRRAGGLLLEPKRLISPKATGAGIANLPRISRVHKSTLRPSGRISPLYAT